MPYFFSQNLETNLGQQTDLGAIIVIWPNQADKSGMTPVEASATLATQVPVVVQNNFTPSIVQAPTQLTVAAATFSVADPGIAVSGEDIPSSVDVSEL